MSPRNQISTSISSRSATVRAPGRLYGLDWLRAMAAILVVMLHAAIPYMSDPLPGLKWSIEPSERSELVNVIGWSINGFIMPVFFLITGYFAARLLHQRGTGGFLKHRLKRIGGPLLFGMVVILPLDLYAWLLGFVNEGLIPFQKLRSLKIEGELGDSLFGVSHLWYLEYVLVYCLCAALLSHIVSRGKLRTKPRTLSFRNAHSYSTLWLATGLGILIGGSVLWWQPRIVIGFRHCWLPCWENLIFYAVPFSLGWFWNQLAPVNRNSTEDSPSPFAQTSSATWQWGTRLALACGCFVLLWPLLREHVAAESRPVSRAVLPFLFTTFNVLISTALFGGALALTIKRVPAVVSYLSQASFWIYLFHHPVVGLTHVDLTFVQAPPLVKFFLATSLTLGLCLLTYEGMVRSTWVGQLLNGYKEQPRRWKPAVEAIPSLPDQQAA